MTIETLWFSPTDFVTGDPTLRVSYPFVSHPAVEIQATRHGDLKWVEMGLPLPPQSEIEAVRVCYQLSNHRSFISQVRLTEMQTPERALVVHDDGAGSPSTDPTCYLSELSAPYRPNGAVSLALRLNFHNGTDKITLGSVGVDVNVPNAGECVPSIAALRALPNPMSYGCVSVLGYYDPGDEGGGSFWFDSTATVDDDSGMVIKPDDTIVPPGNLGRWRRQVNGIAISVKWFGARGKGGISDRRAIQDAIDYAINEEIYKVCIPSGNYRINDTIKVWYGDRFEGIEIEGTPSYLGHSKITANFTDRPALNIQGARSVKIKDIAVEGQNTAPDIAVTRDDNNILSILPNLENWITPGCSNGRYNPYAGIAVDAYSGRRPGAVVQTLFTIPWTPELQGALNKENLSDELIRQFAENDTPLIGDARILGEARNRSWLVRDRSNQYFIIKDGDLLNISKIPSEPTSESYPNDDYYKRHSSSVILEGVTIRHFVVGIAMKPSNDDNNADTTKIKDSTISRNAIGVSIGGSQERNCAIENTGINFNYVAITTMRNGKRKGQFPYVYNCNFGLAVRLFEIRADVGASSIEKIHAESFAEIGILGYAFTSALAPIKISGSNLNSYLFANYIPSKLAVIFQPVEIDSCHVSSYEGLANFVIHRNGGLLKINNTTIASRRNIHSSSMPSSRYLNSNLEPRNNGRLRANNAWRIRSDNSAFSFGVQIDDKSLDDFYKIDEIPVRLKVSPNTLEIFEHASRTRYKIVQPENYASDSISNLRVEGSTISFDATQADIFQVGDYLYWQTAYRPPFFDHSDPDFSYKDLIPALKVSSIVGSAITADILFGDLDLTYLPTEIYVLRESFVNKPSAPSQGDVIAGSNIISNVTNMENLSVGDWIFGRSLASSSRITGIDSGSSTITLNRNSISTASGVEIYNSQLIEI